MRDLQQMLVLLMAVADKLAEALQWLATADARSAAAYEVTSRSLPVALADDLLGIVALALARRFAASPAGGDGAGGQEPEDPIAYARRALARRAIDLQRAEIRERHRRVTWPPAEADDDHDNAMPVMEDISMALHATDAVADLRRALHPLVAGPRPWAAAAGYTVLTLTIHRNVALPGGTPRPEAASDHQAVRWAALYLAGLKDCFPGDGREEDAAMRKRRSRAGRALDEALARAAAASGLEAPRG